MCFCLGLSRHSSNRNPGLSSCCCYDCIRLCNWFVQQDMHPDPVVVEVAFESGYQMPEKRKMKRAKKSIIKTLSQFEGEKFQSFGLVNIVRMKQTSGTCLMCSGNWVCCCCCPLLATWSSWLHEIVSKKSSLL